MDTVAQPDWNFRRRVLRLWLMAVAALVLITLLVGGATRLTESGLSIVEWKLVAGMVPPLNEGAWLAEFEKYQASSQYRLLTRGMTLGEFKTIFWWEWTHRLLGRLLGAVFLLPFLWFLWRGWIERGLKARLWVIFGLGAIQGAAGWWMVASGLDGRVSVSPYRLAFHMTLACVIYVALLWTAQRLSAHEPLDLPRRFRFAAVALFVLVLIQVYLGALVAGLDAGLAYNTWPLIDGSFVPAWERLMFLTPAWRNFFENGLTVQFNHRILAYVLYAASILHLVDVVRSRRYGAAVNGALTLASVLLLQIAVGIVTLLNQAPVGLALLHQGMAMAVLTVAVLHAERVTVKSAPFAALDAAEAG
ncbi:MAG: COX15/CtaA family protein [Xanthobacteraceae bacterium]